MKSAYLFLWKKFNPAWHILSLVLLAMISLPAMSAISIADSDITEHVESEFISDPVVPFNKVNVTTDEGIVTLTGSVSNILAKDRATRIAETVRGVRSVINRVEVNPTVQRTENALRDAVRNALLYDPATDSYEINVNATDKGQITLNGNVDSWQERDLAETVAKGVSGVTGVINRIAVKSKLTRTDLEIKPEIEKKLHWDTLVDGELINVQVDEGKVSLTGIVGSGAEKRRALWAAWVGGVKSVDGTALEVAKWARDESLRTKKYVARSDLEVREAVQDALLYDPRVSPFTIQIKVNNGNVTLRGVVDNHKARIAAERDARNTVSVISVNNFIKVRPNANVSDKKIAENVRNALLRSPFADSNDIDVDVNNQIVRLEGAVDSYFEKAEAENIALLANGVTRVRNNLTVINPIALIYDPYVYDWSIYDYAWYDGVPNSIANKDDWEIKQDIEDELAWSPFVDSEDVNVRVMNGIATLTGTVDSIRENNAAETNAFEGGAIGVINKLNITLLNDRLFIGGVY